MADPTVPNMPTPTAAPSSTLPQPGSLFQTIQKNLQNQSLGMAAPQGSDVNQTQTVQGLLAAKSGKAGAGIGAPSGPGISNIGEQIANAQTKLQNQQLTQQGELAAAGLGQQAQQAQQEQVTALAQSDEQSANIQNQFNLQHAAILNQYTQGEKQLDMNKDAAKFEQIGFNLRLSNQQYLDQLNKQATEARLDNQVNFTEAINRSVFAQEQDLFANDLTFRSALGSDQRAFNDQMNKIDTDFALKVAAMGNQQANQQMLWTGIGGLGSAGAQAYGKQNQFNQQTDTSGLDTGASEGEG